MESALMKALQLIVAFIILVTVHELGHYIFARIFGVKVNKFYLFFNPGLSLIKYDPMAGTLSFLVKGKGKAAKTIRVGKPHEPRKDGKPTWRDTIYGLGWLPLGGYCAIAGMVDETQSKEQLAAEPQPWEFRSKAAWKRLLIMVGGVMFNFILAIVIYAGIVFWWGEKVTPYENRTEGMNFSAEMQSAGFRPGDILLKLNGESMDPRDVTMPWKAIQPGAVFDVSRQDSAGQRHNAKVVVDESLLKSIISKGKDYQAMWTRIPVCVNQPVAGEAAKKAGLLNHDRILKVGNDTTPYLDEFFPAMEANKGKTVDFEIARGDERLNIPIEISDGGKIGISLLPPDSIFETRQISYNIFEAVPRGWAIGTGILTTYVSSLKMLFTKEGAKSLGGFGAIADQFPDKWNWPTFWYMTAFLSVILAFMNIIPIPALDGGYTLFLLWEMITRRKPSDRFLEIANTIGLLLLVLLLVFANGNDIYRFLFK